MTPLFPLHIPLMPHCQSRIKVFEKRYLDMVSDTLRNNGQFVITQILQGSEIYDPSQSKQKIEFSDYGCLVSIKDFDQNESLELLLEATQLVHIKNPIQNIHGLWESELEVLDFDDLAIDANTHDNLVKLYDTLKQHPYLKRQSLLPDTNNSLHILNFLCMWLPLNEDIRITLMKAPNTVIRTQKLYEALESIEQDFAGF